MLADRFALKVHQESKEMQVYVLEIAKSGAKLKKSEAARPFGAILCRTRDRHRQPACWISASNLSKRIALPVVDQTGLKDLYDFELHWIPGQGEGSVGAHPIRNRPPVVAVDH